MHCVSNQRLHYYRIHCLNTSYAGKNQRAHLIKHQTLVVSSHNKIASKGKWSIPSFRLYTLKYPVIRQLFKAVQKTAHFKYWFWRGLKQGKKTNKNWEKHTNESLTIYLILWNYRMSIYVLLLLKKALKEKKTNKAKKQAPSSNCSHEFNLA